MRKVKPKFYPEGIDRPRWMLFADREHNWRWRYFWGTGDLYEQLCQWNARLRYAGYNRKDHPKAFAMVQSLYSAACDQQEKLGIEYPGVLMEHNTALSPLDLTKRKWHDKVGRFLWKWRLI